MNCNICLAEIIVSSAYQKPATRLAGKHHSSRLIQIWGFHMEDLSENIILVTFLLVITKEFQEWRVSLGFIWREVVSHSWAGGSGSHFVCCKRSEGREWWHAYALPFSLFLLSRTLALVCAAHTQVGLFYSVKPLWKLPHRHAKRYIF